MVDKFVDTGHLCPVAAYSHVISRHQCIQNKCINQSHVWVTDIMLVMVSDIISVMVLPFDVPTILTLGSAAECK